MDNLAKEIAKNLLARNDLCWVKAEGSFDTFVLDFEECAVLIKLQKHYNGTGHELTFSKNGIFIYSIKKHARALYKKIAKTFQEEDKIVLNELLEILKIP